MKRLDQRRKGGRGRGVGAASTEVRLWLSTLEGLESLLSEELTARFQGEVLAADSGQVLFKVQVTPPLPRDLGACNYLQLLVRRAEGDFRGARGLAVVKQKLARTEFDHALRDLNALQLPKPSAFRVRAAAAPECGFTFFDLSREAFPILEHRLALPPTDAPSAFTVAISCLPHELWVGFELPLIAWPIDTRNTPRSLLGAAIRLAQPRPQLTVCDPDCGRGELLAAWEALSSAGRCLGLSWGAQTNTIRTSPLVIASPRAWPIASGKLSRVISLLPRVRTAAQLAHLVAEMDRSLAVGGRAVLATSLEKELMAAVTAVPHLQLERIVRARWNNINISLVVLVRPISSLPHRTPLTAGDRWRATAKLGGSWSHPKSHAQRTRNKEDSRQLKREHPRKR
ncbi:MAG: hypothetical protein ACUVX8_14635 [Candidatus Zipacnadales bacterium]